MSAAAYCIERERERERERAFFDEKSTQFRYSSRLYRRSVTRVKGSHCRSFGYEISRITWILLGIFFTEVRHCVDRVVNSICIARFEILRAVMMEDVLISVCLFVGKRSTTFRRNLLPRNIAVYRSPRRCASEDFNLDLSSSCDVSVALLNIQNNPLS